MKGILKSIVLWALGMTIEVAGKTVANCTALELKVRGKPKSKVIKLDESGKEITLKPLPVKSDVGHNIVTNILPVTELPTELYIAEYFTMPEAFRVYGTLVQAYKTELLWMIMDNEKCNENKALFILSSMEYYLEQLRLGNNHSFLGHTDWLTDYAKMVKIVRNHDTVDVSNRASMVTSFLGQVENVHEVLGKSEELLLMVKHTGALPASIPLVVVDMLAFINIPSYMQRRLDIINGTLKSNMKMRGEFSVN